MGGFSELIKNFDKTRDYIRDFFIYGFKVRNDFERKKSLRTYDDEKRRVESWLGKYIKYDNSQRGKKVSISVDSGIISENPLYSAYYSKSFTENDIKLHFYIIDVLYGGKTLTLKEIVDTIDSNYNEIFDVQTIRNKLKEYIQEGIIISKKSGRTAYFRLSEDTAVNLMRNYKGLADAVKFFSETQPLGIVGNSILKSANLKNDIFIIKHNYIVHTLEDIVIPEILSAMEQKRYITIGHLQKSEHRIRNIVPLQILSATQTGRRYLAVYSAENERFITIRLDFIRNVKLCDICPEYDTIYEKFMNEKKYCFGVSFGSWYKEPKKETIVVDFLIDEEKESFVVERLYREKRNGTVEKTGENKFRLTVKTYDTGEVIPWIRTFTGKVTDIKCDNKETIKKFYSDICFMHNIIYKEN